ncbi:MAG: DMT family transporter [Terriglobales bacterium]
MLIPSYYLPAAFGLTAVGVWGTSDFLGGLGSRRASAFLFTSIVHGSGFALAAALALAIRSPLPKGTSIFWALIAGAVGGSALALFYRALAGGKMGLIAPIAAVLSAGIPTIVTAFSEGLPGTRQILGFVLAVIGVWLISRAESTQDSKDGTSPGNDKNGRRPQGLGTAVLAGIAFAGFYLCIHRAGNGSALWLAVYSRFASLLVTLAFVSFTRQFRAVPRPILAIAVVAGILDITGSVAFIRASQIGRLDVAVVLSSLYPAVTVVLARIFLHEHFSRARTLGMLAALAAVPMIAG